jgi:hypothetical protein
MILGEPNLNVAYYSKFLKGQFSLNIWEMRMIEKYFRKEMGILPEQKIDFESPEVLLIIDIIRYSNNLS